MNRMIHKKKAAMATSFVATARRSVRRVTAERPASTLYYETERGKVPSTAYSLIHALGRVLHSEIDDSHMRLDAEVPASIAKRLRLKEYAVEGTFPRSVS